MEKMNVLEAKKVIKKYDHIVPIDENPILPLYKDEDGYKYYYTIFILAVL